jgi:hypothetical protein
MGSKENQMEDKPDKPDWLKIIEMESQMILETEEIAVFSTDLSDLDHPVCRLSFVLYPDLANLYES